jgi:twinkle protein
MDHVAINLSQSANWKWAVFSPENYPVSQHVAKLAEKIVRKPFLEGKVERMTKDQFLECLPFVRDHFTFLDPDYKDPEFLMAAALNHRPLTKGFGIILDPWNTFEHKRRRDETETEYVGRSLTFIINEARAFGAHVFLVAHPQKMQRGKDGKYPVPGPWDISGSAHWFNKPDNIICVHRDKTDLEAPVEIHVQKVRRKRIGHIGLAELAYDRVTGRYADVQTTTAEDYANRRER